MKLGLGESLCRGAAVKIYEAQPAPLRGDRHTQNRPRTKKLEALALRKLRVVGGIERKNSAIGLLYLLNNA